MIKVPSGYYVALTHINTNIYMSNIHDCRFGGVAFLEKQHQLKMRAQLCGTEMLTNIPNHLKIISQSNHFYIQTYQYHPYSNGTIKLKIKSTTCIGTFTDFSKYPLFHSNDIVNVSMQHLLTLLSATSDKFVESCHLCFLYPSFCLKSTSPLIGIWSFFSYLILNRHEEIVAVPRYR